MGNMYVEVTVYCRDAVSLITKFTNDEVQSYTATDDICLSLSKKNKYQLPNISGSRKKRIKIATKRDSAVTAKAKKPFSANLTAVSC